MGAGLRRTVKTWRHELGFFNTVGETLKSIFSTYNNHEKKSSPFQSHRQCPPKRKLRHLSSIQGQSQTFLGSTRRVSNFCFQIWSASAMTLSPPTFQGIGSWVAVHPDASQARRLRPTRLFFWVAQVCGHGGNQCKPCLRQRKRVRRRTGAARVRLGGRGGGSGTHRTSSRHQPYTTWTVSRSELSPVLYTSSDLYDMFPTWSFLCTTRVWRCLCPRTTSK